MNHTRLAVTATALLIASAVAVVFVANGSPRPSSTVRVISADGVAQPAAQQLTAFTCGASTVPTHAGGSTALIGAIRTGSHPGYDRFVVEFASGVPGSISVTPQASPTFTASPRGDSVTLAGSTALHVVLHDADAHTSFSGSAIVRTNGPALVEVRRLEDFEGYVGLGLGVATQQPCYRAFMLTGPNRLVIDVQAA